MGTFRRSAPLPPVDFRPPDAGSNRVNVCPVTQYVHRRLMGMPDFRTRDAPYPVRTPQIA